MHVACYRSLNEGRDRSPGDSRPLERGYNEGGVVPATVGHSHADESRSTKAGTVVPATRGRPFDDQRRSTMAGVVPATDPSA